MMRIDHHKLSVLLTGCMILLVLINFSPDWGFDIYLIGFSKV